MLGIFEKLDVMVDPSSVEDCHWIKSSKDPKKVIAKVFTRKNVNKISLSKKCLKDKNLSPLGNNSMVHINDSLCTPYKILCTKCREFLFNKYIHSF